jgi:hypothetical protein
MVLSFPAQNVGPDKLLMLAIALHAASVYPVALLLSPLLDQIVHGDATEQGETEEKAAPVLVRSPPEDLHMPGLASRLEGPILRGRHLSRRPKADLRPSK